MLKKGCTYSGMLDGLLAWPKDLLVLRGAEDDDSGDPSDDDKGTGDDEGGKPNESKEGGDEGGSEEDDVPTLKRKLSNLEEERGRNVRKREEAQARVTALEAEVATLKKSGNVEDTVKKQNEDLTTANAKLTTQVRDLTLQNAFLADTAHKWVDPDAAFRLADMSSVDLEDGKAIGMKAALDRLAKDKPYLLKTEEPPKDDKKPPRKTGDQPKNPRQQQESIDSAQRIKLAQKYPALRGRI